MEQRHSPGLRRGAGDRSSGLDERRRSSAAAAAQRSATAASDNGATNPELSPDSAGLRHVWREMTLLFWHPRSGVRPSVLLHGRTGVAWTGPTLDAECRAALSYRPGGFSAATLRRRAVRHLAAGRCSCGIYGLYEAPPLWSIDIVAVDTIVSGPVVVGEQGIRAARGTIVAIHMRPRCGCRVRPIECATIPDNESALVYQVCAVCAQYICRYAGKPGSELSTYPRYKIVPLQDLMSELERRYDCPVLVSWPRERAIGWEDECGVCG